MKTRQFANADGFYCVVVIGLMTFLALSLISCGGGNGKVSGTGSGTVTNVPGNPSLATITGVVQDTSSSHNPVSGAIITVTGANLTATSNAQGTFVINNVPLTATSLMVASPSTTLYYDIANYNGQVYNLSACVLPLPKLIAGANAPYTDIDIYVFSSGSAPPSAPSGCPT